MSASVTEYESEVNVPVRLRRILSLGGAATSVDIVPRSVAGNMARQNLEYLGKKLLECWQSKDGHALRAMLVPADESMEVESAKLLKPLAAATVAAAAVGTEDEDNGFDLFK